MQLAVGFVPLPQILIKIREEPQHVMVDSNPRSCHVVELLQNVLANSVSTEPQILIIRNTPFPAEGCYDVQNTAGIAAE